MPKEGSKHAREPRRHHYVPEFLLRGWAKEWKRNQQLLRGYYWDLRQSRCRYRESGVGAFCHRIDLLTIRSRPKGQADLESIFFQAIDQKGQAAIQAIVAGGVDRLDGEQRSDFIRLLLSLEYRRPSMVDRVRTEGRERLTSSLDQAEIAEEFKKLGVDQLPSEYAQQKLDWSMEERAMLLLQSLVDSREIGERLINAHWSLRRLRGEHSSFLLADRPLVRVQGLDHPAATWFLPLSPRVGLYVARHESSHRLLENASAEFLVRASNIDSAGNAERYVFGVGATLPGMFARILHARAECAANRPS